MKNNFTGICIITNDVTKLAQFYSKVLETRTEENEIHAFVETEGGSLAIYSKTAAEQDMGFEFDKYWGSGNMCLQFTVNDVDLEYQRLNKMGVKLVNKPKTYPWGSRSFQFRDPDGNIVTFVCRIRQG